MEKQVEALNRHQGEVQAEEKEPRKNEHAEKRNNVIVHFAIPSEHARPYRRRTHHRNPARARINPMGTGPGADPVTNHQKKRAHATADTVNIKGPANGSLRGLVRSLFIVRSSLMPAPALKCLAQRAEEAVVTEHETPQKRKPRPRIHIHRDDRQPDSDRPHPLFLRLLTPPPLNGGFYTESIALLLRSLKQQQTVVNGLAPFFYFLPSHLQSFLR